MKLQSMKPLAVAAAFLSAVAMADEAHLKRTPVGPGPDHWPNRDQVIPHVSGDERFSNTWQNWKDPQALAAARQKGLMSHEMNYRDFRWAERSWEGENLAEQGRELFHKKNAKGNSCASCHGTDAKEISDAAARYPAFNKRLGRVVTMPTQISACATEHLGEDWVEDTKSNSLLALYMSTKADGLPINIDVSSGPLQESYERGKDLYFKRTGHFNFACASCHTPPTAGKMLRGQRPTTFFGDAATYPVYHFPYALAGDDLEYLFTLQHQIRSCQTLSRMYPGEEGSPPMTDIEVFLRATSNGFPIAAPVNFYNLDSDYLQ